MKNRGQYNIRKRDFRLMTNDAKKGLLVALLLIIAIVFSVNGLPKVFSGKNQLMQQSYARQGMVREAGDDLMAMARDTVKILNEPAPHEIAPPTVEKIIEKPIVVKKIDEPNPVTKNQTYVVQANDNLASIAQKFYGKELGNTLSNIEKIAKANNLGSSDFILMGQKLIIPPLTQQHLEETGAFAAVKEFFAGSIRNKISLPTVSASQKVNKGQHIVKPEDTLWKIAKKTLGDGSRYKEIARLNNLRNSDSLQVGNKLLLPKR